MKIAIPKESADGEFRVAASPETVKKLTREGISVVVQTGAGVASDISDDQFLTAGAETAADFHTTTEKADVILKIQPPSA